MFFSSLRESMRRLRAAEKARDYWKERAVHHGKEAARLVSKLEERTDFFIEREFRLMDRFLTAKVKTYAITDEIRAKRDTVTDSELESLALEAYLDDKKQFLVECAREANFPDPQDSAARTFEANRSSYVVEFQQQRVN